MAKYFPYRCIPKELKSVVGDCQPATRSFHKYGSESEVGYWYEALTRSFGPVVAPANVNMYVPVSRTAIHKRIKEGRLTAFFYHSKPAVGGLFYKKKEARESAYVFIPVAECKAWAEEIYEKMQRLGHISPIELEEEKPSWYREFENWCGTHDPLQLQDFYQERAAEDFEKEELVKFYTEEYEDEK